MRGGAQPETLVDRVIRGLSSTIKRSGGRVKVIRPELLQLLNS